MGQGFLTPTQREALQSKGNRYTRQLRNQVRNNTKAALEDFAFLLEHAEHRDLTQIAERDPSPAEIKERHGKLKNEREQVRERLAEARTELKTLSDRMEMLESIDRDLNSIEVTEQASYEQFVTKAEQIDKMSKRAGYTPAEMDPDAPLGDSRSSVFEHAPAPVKSQLSHYEPDGDPGQLITAIESWMEDLRAHIGDRREHLQERKHTGEERIEQLETKLEKLSNNIDRVEEQLSQVPLDPAIQQDLILTIAACLAIGTLPTGSTEDADVTELLSTEALYTLIDTVYPDHICAAATSITHRPFSEALADAEKKRDATTSDQPPISMSSRLTELELRALHESDTDDGS